MTPQKVREILESTREIQGWLDLEAAMLLAWVDEIQKRNDVRGDLFEIGVHHGKSAMLLGLMAREDERLGVCDLFDQQHKNVSGSGAGNRQIFDENVRKHLPSSLEIRVLEQSSQDLTPDDVPSNHRLFHVDGGHSPEEAYKDLDLAATSLGPQGVIIVDDPLRLDWLGVTQAIVLFLQKHDAFCAFAAGFNKLLIGRRQAAELYTSAFDGEDLKSRGIYYPWRLRTSPFFGYPTRVFSAPADVSATSITARLTRLYQASPWLQGAILKPAAAIARQLFPHRE